MRIVIIAESSANTVMPVTYELLTLGAAINPDHREVILLGTDCREAAREIAAHSGLPVTAVMTSTEYTPELWNDILSSIIPGRNYDLIIVAHTASGQDFAPGLAARLGAPCITAVESFFRIDAKITFTRSILNGKVLMDITPEAAPCVVTVMPGAFAASPSTPPALSEVTNVSIDSLPCKVIPHGMTQPALEDSLPITVAEVLVSAGRGIGKPENLEQIERLAERFKRSAIAGTRPLCDQGWLPYRRQVGLTGATVSPKLYIACGISGSPQHVAGMKDSQLIIAINKDPHAAIFKVADYCVIADLLEFIPILLEELDNQCAG